MRNFLPLANYLLLFAPSFGLLFMSGFHSRLIFSFAKGVRHMLNNVCIASVFVMSRIHLIFNRECITIAWNTYKFLKPNDVLTINYKILVHYTRITTAILLVSTFIFQLVKCELIRKLYLTIMFVVMWNQSYEMFQVGYNMH